MVRWRLKSCPKCGGDLLIERDLDFWYEQCLQCSHRTELKPVHEYKEHVTIGTETKEDELALCEDTK